ncbi:Ig-like domain-containing protein [Phytoactinopolyspora halophila]|uniref:Ig-like domain-containing protein n=1 Tax=Phytoactinopolyspora halophila TaxID=1981511 RepID=UPI001314FB53|nr:Ig-like domain-containing protein [Phytoactinopolyspora halophila]
MTQRRRLAAAVAVTGASALALGAASLPAAGAEIKPENIDLDESEDSEGSGDFEVAGDLVEPLSSGPEALSQLDESDLTRVAERAGMTAERLESYLKNEQAVVSPSGFVSFVDDWDVPEDVHEPEIGNAEVPGNPIDGSRPDASHTIYIDFDGDTIENTEWNRIYDVDTIEVSPYEVDDDFKHEVWERVAQNYAPFDINVTISDPGDDALNKTSADDDSYGARLLVAPDSEEFPSEIHTGASGRAWLGLYGMEVGTPALVWADKLNHNSESIGMVASHELGHELGLEHHGIGDEEYYYGQTQPAPDALWGPLMGAPFGVPLATWSNGEYADATNPEQDDVATMTADDAVMEQLILLDQNGNRWTDPYCTTGEPNNPQPGDEFFEPNEDNTCNPPGPELTDRWDYSDRTDHVQDSHGDSSDDATSLDNSDGEFAADGLVGTAGDVDVFTFTTDGGPITASVEPGGNRPNLDLKLTLLDAEGDVVAEGEQETSAVPGTGEAAGLDASVDEEVDAGVYYLAVEGRGQGDPQDNTPENGCCYSDYGSLGLYSISGEAEPFDAEPVDIASPEDGAEVERGDLPVEGTAEPEASVALSVDDEVVAEASADDEGRWDAVIEDGLPYGDTTITAQQTVADMEDPNTDSVTVTVPLDAPAITTPEEGDTATNATPTFTGTGVADATVNVTIECGDSTTVEGDADVDGNGEWSFTPEEGLPNGECSVTATQTIGDATSPSTEPVNFTVDVDDSGDDEDDGTEDGEDEEGEDDLPDTGAGNLLTLAAGLGLLAVGGALYARTRRVTV